MTNPPPAASAAVIRLVGDCDVKVWGLSSLERMARIGRRFGVTDVKPYDGTASGQTLLVWADVLVEDRLISALLKRSGLLLVSETGKPVAACAEAGAVAAVVAVLTAGAGDAPSGFTVVRPDAPELGYDDVLRKRAVPYVLDLTATPQRDVEWRMFGASYKGATDFVTKWLWPVPAFHVTRKCAALGLTPNQVTFVGFLLVLAAMALFWHGHFGLGIAAAWTMTFLDTVDGKLARVTVTSSHWGNIFDHGIDMVHPPFWYWAWWVGLGQPDNPALLGALVIIVAGYIVGRLIEGAFIAAFKFEIHVWRRFDYWLRAFTARRNPNMAILTVATIFGAPEYGFILVAMWTMICLLLHFMRLAQALAVRNHGGAVTSFLAEAK